MSVLTDIAAAFAPLMNPDRPPLHCVRFIGSPTDLLAFASDGHVLALVTVLGDFSHVGDAALPGDISSRLGLREWGEEQWLDPEVDKDLTAEAHLRPALAGELSLAMILKVLPKSKAPAPAQGWFLGRALTHLGAVARRLGVRVQFAGADHPLDAMRLDSRPNLRTDGSDDLWWASLAIMPASPLSSEGDSP